MRAHPLLVLASASPARLKLLTSAGIDPEVIVSGVDESAIDANAPDILCATLARMKANAVAQWLLHRQTDSGRDVLVLGCDSVLAFDGEVFGKPENPAEAIKRLHAMRGRSGVLHTGHCLLELASMREVERVASTTVHFAELTDAEIDAYVASGEPLVVAGSFTIDGLGSAFVECIEGDHTNVVGLSIPVLRHLLQDLGWSIIDLWRIRQNP